MAFNIDSYRLMLADSETMALGWATTLCISLYVLIWIVNIVKCMCLTVANYRNFLIVDLIYNISCLFSTLNLTIEYSTHYHHEIFQCDAKDICNGLHDAIYFLLTIRMVALCFVVIIWLIYCSGIFIKDE